MQHVIRPVLCGLALWMVSTLSGTATDYSATMRDLSSYITNQLQATGASSLTLVLVDSNQVVWATGFGLADPITGQAADALSAARSTSRPGNGMLLALL